MQLALDDRVSPLLLMSHDVVLEVAVGVGVVVFILVFIAALALLRNSPAVQPP